MTVILHSLTMLSVLAGLFFFAAGTCGLLRFPDTLTRLHALTKADNLGLGLIALSVLLQTDSALAALKITLVWLLALLSGAIVTQLIANAVRNAERTHDG